LVRRKGHRWCILPETYEAVFPLDRAEATIARGRPKTTPRLRGRHLVGEHRRERRLRNQRQERPVLTPSCHLQEARSRLLFRYPYHHPTADRKLVRAFSTTS